MKGLSDKAIVALITLLMTLALFCVGGKSAPFHVIKLSDGTVIKCSRVETYGSFVKLSDCQDGHTRLEQGHLEIYDEKL